MNRIIYLLLPLFIFVACAETVDSSEVYETRNGWLFTEDNMCYRRDTREPFTGNYLYDARIRIGERKGEKEILCEGRFVDGKRDGKWIWYRSSGRKEGGKSSGRKHLEGYFDMGKPTGEWFDYKSNGSLDDSAENPDDNWVRRKLRGMYGDSEFGQPSRN